MKKFELIFILTVITAALAVLINYPMATQILIVSISLLSVFYLYVGFAVFLDIPFQKLFSKDRFGQINKPRIVGAVALGVALSASLIGILFKLLIWPNAKTQLLIGLSGLILIGAPSIWRYTLNKSAFYHRIFTRLALYIPLIACAIFIPKYAMLEHQYQDYPQYVNAFKANHEQPNDPELQKQLDQAWEEMYKKEN
jgi:hypothetical protein